MPNSPLVAALAALVLSAPVSVPAAAAGGLTGFHPAERPLTVRTSGLDLATTEGRRILDLRLARAARDHCLGDHPLPHRTLTLDYLLCVEETRNAAQPDIERMIRAGSGRAMLAIN